MTKRIMNKLLRAMTPATAAAAGVLIITVIALLTPPYIGMADNGDFFRILYSNGLYFNDPAYDSQYLGYFVKTYGIFQYYNENGATLFSTQSSFIQIAVFLYKLLHPGTTTFDIRFQAILYTILYTIAIYLLVEALTWKQPRLRGYIIAGIVIFVFGDTGYTAYFNSFYGESVMLIMTVFMVASGLLLYRGRYNVYVMLGLLAASAMILTASKQQNAPVGIVMALFGVSLIFIRKKSSYRAITAFLLVALIGVGISTYVLIPKEFVNINKFHAMTRGVLMGSTNPEQTLESFGIDKQYAILNGQEYFEPYKSVDVESKEFEEQFFSKYGFGSILTYYATHPGQAVQMLNIAARDGFSIRPNAMGNYEQSVGKPFGAHTTFFSGYSLLKEALAPKTFGFIALWTMLVVGLYIPSFVAAIRSRHLRHAIKLPLMLALILIGLSGIVVSIIGAGDADLAKHEFLFTLAFDLVTLVTVRDLIVKQLWTVKESIPAQAAM
ncbi:hypothetical protein ABE504_06360 [Paenibacillus oryzisoli]|uniref:glycan biosynthesis hexose transferase WsfD n=1 Tax=Paenibacillus oryzisoli TaxID=1850517 RepID=UPI003D27E281